MRNNEKVFPNELLQHEREQHNWSREYVAEQIRAPEVRMLGRWEREGVLPAPRYRQALCALFGKSARELGFLKPGEVPFWNVPYRRNPFFTGREMILTCLHMILASNESAVLTQPQAISGLGGIGKSQVALEYAYRYAHEYQAVFWVGAESLEILTSNFALLANLLNLKEKDEKDQNTAVDAVKRWLTALSRWLLILDNVDDLTLIADFLPPVVKGHVFLTTRMQASGKMAHLVEVDAMEPEEGAMFLLRRAKLLALDAPLDISYASWAQARAIAQEMGGLPLALDQAGAYIEEAKCGLDEYLTLYQTLGVALLDERGGPTLDHPEAVAGTFLLAFKKVELANPAAADLLRLCAFLAPDTIPEEIITTGAAQLGPVLQPVAIDSFKLDKAIKQLLRYSLVQRHRDTKTLTIHRLVQAVLKNEMSKETQRQWAERAVHAVNRVLPHFEDATVLQCERLLPQALKVTRAIEQYQLISEEAGRLLHETSTYLRERARYTEAEQLFHFALRVREQRLGPEHPEVASPLNNLANLYSDQGKYAEAERLYQRALAIRERQLGPEHPQVASSLNNLAILYKQQGKYTEAEPLYQRALSIWEQQWGPDHPRVAFSLNNLAGLYNEQGKYAEAESLYQRALRISEQQLGPNHPDVAYPLNGLAELYNEQGKYAEAEPLYQRALSIWEQHWGPEHPDVAYQLNGLAELYNEQGKYAEAEPLYQRALSIREQQLGLEHPLVASSLNGLANLYRKQGKYIEAEPLYQRALHIREQAWESQHPETAESMHNLAQLREAQGNSEEARDWYARALTIREQALGSYHPKTMETRKRLIALPHVIREDEKAVPFGTSPLENDQSGLNGFL